MPSDIKAHSETLLPNESAITGIYIPDNVRDNYRDEADRAYRAATRQEAYRAADVLNVPVIRAIPQPCPRKEAPY